MASAKELAQRAANNGQTGVPPSHLNQKQQQQFRTEFAKQQAKNSKR